MFQVTGDKTNFQGRYIIRHEWKGDTSCEVPPRTASLRERRRKSRPRISITLTGWKMDDVRTQMALGDDWTRPGDNYKWWQRLWNK